MRHFRFTNGHECHNGFQYKDGLNVDHNPFDPSEECGPGGLFFFNNDQLGFVPWHLHNGPYMWIREVFLPNDAQVVNVANEKMKADKFILGPRRRITLSLLCELFGVGSVHSLFNISHDLEILRHVFGACDDPNGEIATPSEFVKCAHLHNFSVRLCKSIINYHKVWWTPEEVENAQKMTNVHRLREQPPRACKKRRIAQ